jgi:hypothetical protein
MRTFAYLLLLGIATLPCQETLAQDKPQEKAKSEERAKPSVPIKVQVVFSEFDGEKKVSSMPYSFIVIGDDHFSNNYNNASLRTGVRVPVDTGGADQKTSYMDIGSNIDCSIKSTDDNRYHLFLVFERSALYPNAAAQDEKMQAPRPGAPPLVRQFRASVNTILKDGQTSETVLSTDPLNGHSLRISATINIVK